MKDFLPPGRPSGKPKQSMMLQDAPALRDYYSEQEAITQQTAKLKALRIARDAEEGKIEVPPVAKPKAPRKKAVAPRRGIGSK